jgi:hypothetical protein
MSEKLQISYIELYDCNDNNYYLEFINLNDLDKIPADKKLRISAITFRTKYFNINFFDISRVNFERWTIFMNNIKKNKNDYIDFCNLNGNVSIGYNSYKKCIFFEVSKYGGEGDGCICTEYNVELCMDALNEICRVYEKIEKISNK